MPLRHLNYHMLSHKAAFFGDKETGKAVIPLTYTRHDNIHPFGYNADPPAIARMPCLVVYDDGLSYLLTTVATDPMGNMELSRTMNWRLYFRISVLGSRRQAERYAEMCFFYIFKQIYVDSMFHDSFSNCMQKKSNFYENNNPSCLILCRYKCLVTVKQGKSSISQPARIFRESREHRRSDLDFGMVEVPRHLLANFMAERSADGKVNVEFKLIISLTRKDELTKGHD